MATRIVAMNDTEKKNRCTLVLVFFIGNRQFVGSGLGVAVSKLFVVLNVQRRLLEIAHKVFFVHQISKIDCGQKFQQRLGPL